MLKQWADIVIDMRNWLEDKYGSCWDEELRNECEKIWAKVCSYPKNKILFEKSECKVEESK